VRALSAAELLDVWEAGRDQAPVGRALALLAAACPETPPDRLAALSIGRRDAQLMTLRAWTFGSAVAGVASCPACGDRLDFGFDLEEIRVEAPSATEPIVVQAAGWEVRCRLPSSADLLAVAALPRDGDMLALAGPSRRQWLLERCIVAAELDGESRPTGDLPPELLADVVRALGEADAQADVELALTCPGCDHGWSAAFEVASFFWSELGTWAARTLREVHALAMAYGWPESEILALSPRRRQAYLELIEG